MCKDRKTGKRYLFHCWHKIGLPFNGRRKPKKGCNWETTCLKTREVFQNRECCRCGKHDVKTLGNI